MTRPTERCDVVGRAAPCSENEAAEPTSASPTMDLWSIVSLSVAFERAALVMSSRSRRSSHIFSEGDWLVRKITPSSPSAVLKMPRKPQGKPLDPVEARKVSQLCAKLVAGPQSLSAQNAAVKLAKQLAICPAAAAEVRRAGGVRRLQARPPR